MGVATVDIEDIVRSDPHVKKIIPAENWPLSEVDYSRFTSDSKDFVKAMVCFMVRFLSSKYILDDFSDPHDRQNWRIGMDKMHGRTFWDFYEHNGLKTKMFAQLTTEYSSIADVLEGCYVGENKEKFGFLKKLLKHADLDQSSYDAMSPLEKISYVKKLKQKAYLFLRFLSRKY